MVFTLIGYTPVSFNDRTSDKIVEGIRFYFSGDDGSLDLVGSASFDFFMTRQRLEKIHFEPNPSVIGTEFDILYNRYGKVDSIKSVHDLK